jgi:hypothetical protein
MSVSNSATGVPCRCWTEYVFNPENPEAEYCTVPGWNTEQHLLLERTCTQLIRECEAIAFDENLMSTAQRADLVMGYFPAIVTNASLVLCDVDPDAARRQTGQVGPLKSENVPWLRFRTTLPIEFGVALRDAADFGSEESSVERVDV